MMTGQEEAASVDGRAIELMEKRGMETPQGAAEPLGDEIPRAYSAKSLIFIGMEGFTGPP